MALIGLVLLILIAKEILVFNAETLVLITFVLFISTLFSFSDDVVEFFNGRVESLKKELEEKLLESGRWLAFARKF